MRIIILSFMLLLYSLQVNAQCAVVVDTSGVTHIDCPNGGATGFAALIQGTYTNYSWTNISNGQIYGNGPFVTSVANLDAGTYVVMGSLPYGGCNKPTLTDTFQVYEPQPNIQLLPPQACPGDCNVSAVISLNQPISGVVYTYTIDNSSQNSLNTPINNLCGGTHVYEIIANGNSCGVESFGISQLASMNLTTSTTNEICSSQNGTAVVSITGAGSSALNNYCTSSPQYSNYSNIELVSLTGDNTSINNNTQGLCDTYQDYTSLSADVSPGQSYTITLSLSSCPSPSLQYFNDAVKVFIDWNIDGDFNDLNEELGTIGPQITPWTNTLNFTVPVGAVPGQSRMRVVGQYNPGNNPTFTACDNTPWFGATEDYTIVVNGSVAYPVSYLWSNGATTDSIFNLSSGSYSVFVTDANGCRAHDTVLVSDSGIINTGITPLLQTVCKNNNPDTLIATASGGVGAYQYEWWSYLSGTQSNQAVLIPNQTDSFLIPSTANIGQAYYYCVVSSGTGCTDTTNIITVETVASPLITLHPQDTAVCINASLTISIEDTFFVNVATNTITPIYQWYQNNICDTSALGGAVPATGPGNNTSIYTPQTAAVGISYYYCIVTIPQLVGCSVDTSACAEIIVNPVPTATLTAVPSPACVGDDITLTATPSIPSNLYRFQYNIGSGWINMTNPQMGSTNPIIFSNITTTTQFRVKVREALGCSTSSWQPNNQGITVPISNVVTQPINHY